MTPGVALRCASCQGEMSRRCWWEGRFLPIPKVLMVAYPVRGLDINSSYTIYHLLNEQKKQGAAVICVGEDLDVLLELCDRILVLCAGQVKRCCGRQDSDQGTGGADDDQDRRWLK